MHNAQCIMLNAQCKMQNAQFCSTLAHKNRILFPPTFEFFEKYVLSLLTAFLRLKGVPRGTISPLNHLIAD